MVWCWVSGTMERWDAHLDLGQSIDGTLHCSSAAAAAIPTWLVSATSLSCYISSHHQEFQPTNVLGFWWHYPISIKAKIRKFMWVLACECVSSPIHWSAAICRPTDLLEIARTAITCLGLPWLVPLSGLVMLERAARVWKVLCCGKKR